MLIDFRLPHGTRQRSGDPVRPLVFAQAVRRSDPEWSSCMRQISDFRPDVVGGRTAYRPSGEPRRIRLFLAALPATHRVETPARPGSAFRSATPRDREVMTGSKGAFLSPPCARGGVRRQKSAGLDDFLEAEEGKAGDRSAALRVRTGRWSWGRPAAVAQSLTSGFMRAEG
jgi:hypothetical protein